MKNSTYKSIINEAKKRMTSLDYKSSAEKYKNERFIESLDCACPYTNKSELLKLYEKVVVIETSEHAVENPIAHLIDANFYNNLPQEEKCRYIISFCTLFVALKKLYYTNQKKLAK